jgi:hypothetical protein
MGGAFATGRTGRVDGASSTGPTAVGYDVSAHPLAFRTRGGTGDGASGRGLGTTSSPRCGGGGRQGQIGGCGEAVDPSAAAESAGTGRGEEIRVGGSAEAGGVRVECALKFPSRQRLARIGGGARFACSTPTSAFWARGWRRPQIFFRAGARWRPDPRVLLPSTRKAAVNLRIGAIWGLLELLLLLVHAHV